MRASNVCRREPPTSAPGPLLISPTKTTTGRATPRPLHFPSLSVVVPVRNEEPNLLPLAREIEAALAPLPDWECIWVDDASTDRSRDVLRDLARENARHRCLK